MQSNGNDASVLHQRALGILIILKFGLSFLIFSMRRMIESMSCTRLGWLRMDES